jgi:hypothetical protein
VVFASRTVIDTIPIKLLKAQNKHAFNLQTNHHRNELTVALSRFLVNGSLSFKRTVLLKLQPLRMFSLVLHERVIISFARRAF